MKTPQKDELLRLADRYTRRNCRRPSNVLDARRDACRDLQVPRRQIRPDHFRTAKRPPLGKERQPLRIQSGQSGELTA